MNKEALKDIKKKLKGCRLTKFLPLSPKKNKKAVNSDEGVSQVKETKKEEIIKVNDGESQVKKEEGVTKKVDDSKVQAKEKKEGNVDNASKVQKGARKQATTTQHPNDAKVEQKYLPPMGYAHYPSMAYPQNEPTEGLAPQPPPPPPLPEYKPTEGLEPLPPPPPPLPEYKPTKRLAPPPPPPPPQPEHWSNTFNDDNANSCSIM